MRSIEIPGGYTLRVGTPNARGRQDFSIVDATGLVVGLGVAKHTAIETVARLSGPSKAAIARALDASSAPKPTPPPVDAERATVAEKRVVQRKRAE